MNIIFLALIQGICRIWVVTIAFELRSIRLSNSFFSQKGKNYRDGMFFFRSFEIVLFTVINA